MLHWIIVHIHQKQDEYIMEIHQHVLFFDLNQKFEFLDQVHHGKNEILASKKKKKYFRYIIIIITHIWLVLAITIASGWSSTHFFVTLIYLKYSQKNIKLFFNNICLKQCFIYEIQRNK